MQEALRYIGWFVAVAYVAFAIFDLRAIVFALSVVGGALIVLGPRALEQRPWPGAAMISSGAVLGAFPIFWSLLAPLLAIALVVLSVVTARRLSAAPA